MVPAPTLPRQVLARALARWAPRRTMTRTAPLRLHTTPREKHENQAGQGRSAAAAETGGWEVGRMHDTRHRDKGGSAKCGRVTPFSSPAPARPPPRVPCPSCTCALAPYPGLLASWHNGAPASPVEARWPSSCAPAPTPAPCQCPSVCFIPPQLSPSAVDRSTVHLHDRHYAASCLPPEVEVEVEIDSPRRCSMQQCDTHGYIVRRRGSTECSSPPLLCSVPVSRCALLFIRISSRPRSRSRVRIRIRHTNGGRMHMYMYTIHTSHQPPATRSRVNSTHTPRARSFN
ncbi:hypothetical protein C8Q74DRAFT_92635 [Fomes fomentarius]|nr:hypothetical protein C8Q74DRAFT_92635 [Fomes fomentarius]